MSVAAGDGSGLIDIGGRRLFARWAGAGTPTVVLEAALDEDHTSWAPVLESIAASTRVVAYDRASLGRSDRRSDRDGLSWTGCDAAYDLARLLQALELPPPYVLVGHSLGGMLVRLVADRMQYAVAGLVLVDASHEEAHAGYLRMLEGAARAAYAARIRHNAEGIDFEATCDEVRTARPLREVPLVVLTGMRRHGAPPGWPEDEVAEMWLALQRRLVGLSPLGRHVLAQGSGHFVQQDEPALVVDAVRSVVAAVRSAAEERDARPAPARVWCIVPHPRSARILLLPPEPDGPEARPALLGAPPAGLPRVEIPRFWLAAGVRVVAERVEEQLGLRATVLRHLAERGDHHLCELEAHDGDWSPPPGSRWAGLDDLLSLGLREWEHGAALERWFGEQAGAEPVPEIRPQWERRGWHDRALAWADAATERAGWRRTGPPVQVKGAWCGSCILRLPTTGGDLYLKVSYERPPGEPALVAALAERWPGHVPQLVAIDAAQRWMLMRDFGSRYLRTMPVVRWENAARQFAALQADCATCLDRWLALGCEDRRLHTLPQHLDRLLGDAAALGRRQGWALTPDEVAEVQAIRPRIAGLCQELAAAGLPDSIVQQDFRDGNLVVVEPAPGRPGGFVFFDWSDSVVSHPFWSGIRMLEYINQPFAGPVAGPSGVPAPLLHSTAARRRYVRDAYLEPWTAFAPAGALRRAFATAWTLNPLWQTIRWWLELPYYEATSPWGALARTWAPDGLRRVLRTLRSPQPS